MSVYTAGIKSWNIDPQFHKSKLRDEFRLDRGYPALFYSTLRILNIGVVTDKQQTRYNYLTGAHGAIKNIYLMDGKRVLDQLISAAPYIGFLKQMKPNASQMDLDKKLIQVPCFHLLIERHNFLKPHLCGCLNTLELHF